MSKQFKRILATEITPGLVTGKPVLNEEGKVVLSEGTVLTASLIERLWQWGITYIEIISDQEPEAQPPAQEPAACTTVVLSGSARMFANDYEDTILDVKRSFEAIRQFGKVPVDEIQSLVDDSVCALVGSSGALNHMQMIKGLGDYTFQHSLNVAIIAGLLAKWTGSTALQLRDIIFAGLLHDIGKTQIPLEILNKPDKLLPDEMEIVKKHTTYGYNLIKDRMDLPAGVLYGILQHHERMDGSGYPLGVPGAKIHPYARIIAVADIYDAMTSNRTYQKGCTPFDVVQILVQEMFNKLDPEICTVFLNNARDYLLGNVVSLSDGRTAEVMYIAQFVGAKPILRTMDGEFIDLEKRKDIQICGVVRS